MTETKPDKQAVCARCGAAIDLADSFVICDAKDGGQAEFCRLEHIVAWCLRGGQWQAERPWELDQGSRSATGTVDLLRRRDGAELRQSFESIDQLREWASRGGFWAT